MLTIADLANPIARRQRIERMDRAEAPRPVKTPETWQELAACADGDPDLFFDLFTVTEAKTICHGCPVEADCLTYALDQREDHGVWGGQSEDGRRKILRRRARQAVR